MKLQDKHENLGFHQLGLSPTILAVLDKLNLKVPTPIQAKSIPVAMAGQDLIGVAQTGTGKTFAFGIPMLERLAKHGGRGLILLPTRELAIQVNENLRKLANQPGFKVVTLIGGENIGRQLSALRNNPQIIVATPGRLIDHIKRRSVRLGETKILVLDEADMMFDMGFAPQVEQILSSIPKDRQTMLFSATMPPAIMKLTANHMKMPVHIEVAPQGTTAEGVDQEIYIVKREEKFKYLEQILEEYHGSVLVFVRTKSGVKALTRHLKADNHKAIEIHSDLSFARRLEALAGFKSKKYRILIGTDVAARGIDVSNIELVVNYDLPDNIKDYVHRIGRTGRAGSKGKAISLAATNQYNDIRDIERLINKKIETKKFAELDSAPARSSARPSFNRNRQRSFFSNKSFDRDIKHEPRQSAGPVKFGAKFRSHKPNGTSSFGSRFRSDKPSGFSSHNSKARPQRTSSRFNSRDRQ